MNNPRSTERGFHLFPFEDFLFDGLEDDEETRHDEKQGDGTDEHTTDGANTE